MKIRNWSEIKCYLNGVQINLNNNKKNYLLINQIKIIISKMSAAKLSHPTYKFVEEKYADAFTWIFTDEKSPWEKLLSNFLKLNQTKSELKSLIQVFATAISTVLKDIGDPVVIQLLLDMKLFKLLPISVLMSRISKLVTESVLVVKETVAENVSLAN